MMTGIDSLPPLLVEQLNADTPASVMGVEFETVTARGEVVFSQEIQDWQYDNHKRLSPSSLGVLIDVAAGSSLYLDRPNDQYMVSHLGFSMLPWASEHGKSARATSTARLIDDSTGTGVTTTVIESGKQTLGLVDCRCVQVNRRPLPAAEGSRIAVEPEQFNEGPIGALLGINSPTRASIGIENIVDWKVPAWCLNSLGTVQGGCLFSATASVAETVGGRLAGENDHCLTGLSIEILRPLFPGVIPYKFNYRILKQGSRVITMLIELRDSENNVYLHSTASLLQKTKYP